MDRAAVAPIASVLWGRGTVELEPEVRRWLEDLSGQQFGRVAFRIDLLESHGPLLGEPYTKQLDGKLRELRFDLHGEGIRITYWIASGRRIVRLTVFRKTRWREAGEIDRARQALARCVAEAHTVREDEQ